MKISILGAGSWGSALTVAFSSISDVCLWSRNSKQVTIINKEHANSGYLPDGVKFGENVIATDDLNIALNTDLIVIATPVNALRSILLQIKSLCEIKHGIDDHSQYENIPDIIWVCKGFEAGSGQLPHNILEEVFASQNVTNYGALLGPSFAFDVANSSPTAITLSSKNTDFAFRWVEIFKPIPNFRVYVNSDIIGCEVGSAVKNIIAIASGIVDGLNLGYNARAALITRSLNELSKLIIALGGNEKTAYGLTGVGDLILTCTGDLSRNRIVGLKLASGRQLDEILRDLGHVAEGVLTTKEVYHLARKLSIDMPIVEAVYNVLYNQYELRQTIIDILARKPKLE
ncbi:MAG: NAD(P)H-dependent glycerol-3-phosphate dehydrogenase [Neisseriaceae bacterium]|jgi:glycerol-3-phosphate dehydrogenase (NAD(P)+)